MKNSALVSIVVPVYNVISYLDECLQSIISQTYPYLEIILVDDGSTDGSGEKCDEYAANDKRFIVIHKENGGLSSARNAGTERAAGEYIYYLDSDDYIKENAIEQLVNEMRGNPCDFIFFEAQAFADGMEASKHSTYKKKQEYASDRGRIVLDKLLNNKEYSAPVQLLFFQMAFIVKNELKFEIGIIHEDELFTFQCFMLAQHVRHYPHVLYHKRMRSNSIITKPKSEKNYTSMRTVCDRIGSFCKQNNLDGDPVCSKYLNTKMKSILWLYQHMDKNDKKQLKESHRQFRRSIVQDRGNDNKVLYYRALNWPLGMAYSGLRMMLNKIK